MFRTKTLHKTKHIAPPMKYYASLSFPGN